MNAGIRAQLIPSALRAADPAASIHRHLRRTGWVDGDAYDLRPWNDVRLGRADAQAVIELLAGRLARVVAATEQRGRELASAECPTYLSKPAIQASCARAVACAALRRACSSLSASARVHRRCLLCWPLASRVVRGERGADCQAIPQKPSHPRHKRG